MTSFRLSYRFSMSAENSYKDKSSFFLEKLVKIAVRVEKVKQTWVGVGMEGGKLAQAQTSLCCCSTTWAENPGTASDATLPVWHNTAASGQNTRLSASSRPLLVGSVWPSSAQLGPVLSSLSQRLVTGVHLQPGHRWISSGWVVCQPAAADPTSLQDKKKELKPSSDFFRISFYRLRKLYHKHIWAVQ